MPDDKNKGRKAANASVDKSLGVEINGEMYYPIPKPLTKGPSELNPCAGKTNNTSCGPGCICLNGQCYYTLSRLKQMGVTVRDK